MRTNAMYTPYGAYELKSLYQRNLTLAALITASFILAVVVIAGVISAKHQDALIDAPVVVIRTVADLGPPPSVAPKTPQVHVQTPAASVKKYAIPAPVPDDEVLDEDIVIASRDELAEIVAPAAGETSENGVPIVVDIDELEFLPPDTAFIPVEVYPEMIHQHVPKYPRLAEQAGITGLVWVRALIDEQGNVIQAKVGRSSGVRSLDDAAVRAAYECKFKPGIQNNRPVKVWVTYKVEFELTD